MKAARKIHWATVPAEGEELFGRQPNFSTETVAQRVAMKRLRKSLQREYADAFARWNAGERDVVFPAGTVRMRLRHRSPPSPSPSCSGHRSSGVTGRSAADERELVRLRWFFASRRTGTLTIGVRLSRPWRTGRLGRTVLR
jgi:hypothetical protein